MTVEDVGQFPEGLFGLHWAPELIKVHDAEGLEDLRGIGFHSAQ